MIQEESFVVGFWTGMLEGGCLLILMGYAFSQLSALPRSGAAHRSFSARTLRPLP